MTTKKSSKLSRSAPAGLGAKMSVVDGVGTLMERRGRTVTS